MARKFMAAAVLLAVVQLRPPTSEISVTNLTGNTYFTPLIIAAHPAGSHLFQPASQPGTAVQAMAEAVASPASGRGGRRGRSGAVRRIPRGLCWRRRAALRWCRWSTTAGNTRLSLAAMLLPTNDGFVGLDSWTIPTTPGTYTVY